MHTLALLYAVGGGLSLLVALVSARVRELPLSEPLLALLTGVLVGPAVLSLLHLPPHLIPSPALEVARLLLAVSVMGVALRYRVAQMRPLMGPLALLILVVMPAMAAATAGLAWLFLGIPLAVAALLGACLSPTDPVLASSVVTGDPAERDLPGRTRRLLSWESGGNDGLAFPLVVLALAAVLHSSMTDAVAKAAYVVVVALVLGFAIGAAAGKAEAIASRDKDVDTGSRLVFTVVLAVTTLGAARLLQVDGILAAFVAGLAFNWFTPEEERERGEEVDEAVNRYLVLPFFVLLGIALPWKEWAALGWAGLAFAVAVLFLRRLPLLLALRVPLRLAWRDGFFMGWFGPVGVSALFYVLHAMHKGVEEPPLWAAATLVVAVSTVAHGLSSSPGRRWYARVAESARDGESS